jgi:hypothetical protein
VGSLEVGFSDEVDSSEANGEVADGKELSGDNA